MNQITPNTNQPLIDRTKVDTSKPTPFKPVEGPRKTGASEQKKQSGGTTFSDVIKEAQQRSAQDSREIDLQETVQASQTGRLMRSKGNREETGAQNLVSDAVEDENARDSKAPSAVELDDPLLERVHRNRQQADANEAVETAKAARTNSAEAVDKTGNPESKSQKFNRVTTKMTSPSDIGRFVSADAFKKIAAILDRPENTRLPGADKLLNQQQLIASKG